MSKWGVFDKVDPPHVIPVDENGFATNDHIPYDKCWCEPRMHQVADRDDPRCGKDVIVHNDKERGGCDG
jgi:hypothetical protein